MLLKLWDFAYKNRKSALCYSPGGFIAYLASVMWIVRFRVILTFQCATHDWKSGYWHWNVRSTFNRQKCLTWHWSDVEVGR